MLETKNTKLGLQAIKSFVDGAFLDVWSDETVEVTNPSNGQLLMELPVGTQQDVSVAVKSARHAFQNGHWCKLPPSQRKAIMHRFADLIQTHASRLDRLDAIEMGKSISLRVFDASAAAGLTRFYAESIDKITGDVLSSDCSTFVTSKYFPRGVVAAITPWNFPTFNAVLKVAPALAAGNSVVLKPSELSSQSAIQLAMLALEAGLPEGVFNVVPGLGATVGRALALDNDVDMVAFTGSTKVGKLMMRYASESNMKPVVAECGGKSPHIIFNDGVDLDAAAANAAQMILLNQGQVCSIGTRLLVQEGAEELVVEKIVQHLESVKPGDASDESNNFGPLVSVVQRNRVLKTIQKAKDEGADLVCGGRAILAESGGNFVEPTVFVNVDPYSDIAQQEIFGPVLSVISFKDTDDAIRLANATAYGLAAYIWSTNLSNAMRMGDEVRGGLVMINGSAPSGEGPGHAFFCEPYGASGVGVEGGMQGLKTYMRQQMLWVNK